uniref:Ptp2 n=1 Tax=Mamestra brassicae nuclear polyhedrosis virus TaxID=78219 RepID=J7H7H9_NPVMB|nr:ptp2 [Mamestra brassicae multiple nucleopolyhedrovirus]
MTTNQRRHSVILGEGDPINVTRITDKLYLGAIIYDLDTFKRFIADEGIDAIVSVWDERMLALDKLGVSHENYMYIYISDNEQANIMQHFDAAYNFLHHKIDIEKKKVYVHCHAGLSRSPTLVLCYLMRQRRIPLEEAYRFVSKKRSIRPNNSFWRQLQMYESNVNIMNDGHASNDNHQK